MSVFRNFQALSLCDLECLHCYLSFTTMFYTTLPVPGDKSPSNMLLFFDETFSSASLHACGRSRANETGMTIIIISYPQYCLPPINHHLHIIVVSMTLIRCTLRCTPQQLKTIVIAANLSSLASIVHHPPTSPFQKSRCIFQNLS